MPADDPFAQTATSASVPPTAPARPQQLGKYALAQQLGAGGMGVVYAAFDPDLERRVAIKLLHEAPGDVTRARLLREARAMARLSHPNVVVVHEVNTIDGRDFVAMELIDGESLADWLRRSPKQTDILDVFVAAGNGLAAAHGEGIVHRDFKPHNVLRSRKGRVVVTDFGLARGGGADPTPSVPDQGAKPVAVGTPALTATGVILGTPAYMAPEQWAGGEVGPASDQFAFCVALWEALAGERPFRGSTAEELRARVEGGPASLDVSKVPRRFRKLLLRGLARDPAARWPSMEALLAAIAAARRDSVKNALWAAGLGIAIFIAINIVINVVRWMRETPEPPEVPLAVGSASHDDVIKSVAATDEHDFVIARASVEAIIDHRELFERDGRLVKTLSDSEPLGFKVYAIKPGSLYAAFHLQNGDTIVSIDNIGFVDEHVDDIIRTLRRKSHIVVDIHRKGSPIRIGVTIQ